jgi:hypothetical protein
MTSEVSILSDMSLSKNKTIFHDAAAGLLAGDFSRLAPLLADDAHEAGQRCAIIG